VKEAAHDGEVEFNDKLANHLCTENDTSFWKAWKKRFCSRNLKSASTINGVSCEENILKEFTGHFSQVSQPNTQNADLKHEARVREFLVWFLMPPVLMPVRLSL